MLPKPHCEALGALFTAETYDYSGFLVWGPVSD